MVSELLLECKHFLDLVQHGGIVKKMDENKQSN